MFFNRFDSSTLQVKPSEFYDLLSIKVDGAIFHIENSTALFHHGYLFMDGIWITVNGDTILSLQTLFGKY